MSKIINKLKKSELIGRSGSQYPVWLKWESFLNKKSDLKYIICNAAEGEPYNKKDFYILNNHLEEVVEGIKIALKTFKNSEAIIYLKHDYYELFKYKIQRLIYNQPIRIVKKTGGYLAGEETVLINSIEEKRMEPENKPPFPSEKGLFNYPTLINNVETFYYIFKVNQGDYNYKKMFSIEGRNSGVFELSEKLNMKDILISTDNYPEENFFVLAGGFLSGDILLKHELSAPLKGVGSIIVYNDKKTDKQMLLKKIINMLLNENCDKCVPCREGIYRINENLSNIGFDLENVLEITETLKCSSFCSLGIRAGCLIESIVKKLF